MPQFSRPQSVPNVAPLGSETHCNRGFGNGINLLAILALLIQVSPLFAEQKPPEYNGVLLDFSASWCGPCRQVAPIVEQMERQGLPVKKIDVDQQRTLANQFRVTGIPCFVLIVNGQEVQRLSGYQSETTLRSLVARIPVKQAPPAQANQQMLYVEGSGEKNRTQPPQYAGEPTPQSQPSQVQTPQNDQDTKGKFHIPFLGKSKPARVNNGEIQARAKIDELKLPKLDRPSPMASSTRICVKNRKNGSNLGSGTIISSEIGQTYILTCGHVFRDYESETSVIEVDFFVDPKEAPVTFVGKLVKSDLKADVGLISIPTDTPLPVSPIAPADFRIQTRDSVLSIGCAGGEVPTEQQLAVTRINRYSGPHNIECTGVPEQGRSGGGLFSPDGYVIGVCTAADKRDQRGIYAGYQAVHQLLSQVGLTHLYLNGKNTDLPTLAARGEKTSKSSRSEQLASRSSDSAENIPLPLQKLRSSLGDLGGEEVVVRLQATDSGKPQRMMILRDSALTSRTGANPVYDGDEAAENR